MTNPQSFMQAFQVFDLISNGLLIVYSLVALSLALYTLGQFALLLQLFRRPSTPASSTSKGLRDSPPIVTIQLPIYNERYVVSRLLDAIAQFDYPRDCLEIQVLDDSNDVTQVIVAQAVAQLRAQGFHVAHIQRINRQGYKAGALAYGLAQASGEYIAIFDADFMPAPDFLWRTLAVLQSDEGIGMVQTRWGHLNADENWLTRAQRLAIDSHFVIEQTARARAGWFVPFNGTGGVWRRQCIDDAGGWSDATLTEDFDLSYRAQLLGWRTAYLPDCIVPAELPPQLSAYRQQQMRWAMGSTQCLKRLAIPVWRTRHLSWATRLMATQHLFQYVPQLLMVLLLWMTPILLATGRMGDLSLTALGVVGVIPPLMLGLAQGLQVTGFVSWWQRMQAFPVLVMVATGTSYANGRAVWRALRGLHEPFRRTPKFADETQHPSANLYHLRTLPTAEAIHAVYAWASLALAWQVDRAIIPYLLIYALSFTGVAGWLWYETRQSQATTQSPSAPATSVPATSYSRQSAHTKNNTGLHSPQITLQYEHDRTTHSQGIAQQEIPQQNLSGKHTPELAQRPILGVGTHQHKFADRRLPSAEHHTNAGGDSDSPPQYHTRR